MSDRAPDVGALNRYSRAAERAAAQIITSYSTSFGSATLLLGSRHRGHVRNLYALVRVADELVDGVGTEAVLTADAQGSRLDELEAETERAVRTGYSSNPVVHAFATTARAAGIDDSLTRPFFASMRMDLEGSRQDGAAPDLDTVSAWFDAEKHDDYVYGSAEVVGLMCLRVFLRDETVSAVDRQTLEHGARRLGAAFQNVNFLRDLADDSQRLGRSYLSDRAVITPELQRHWIDVITGQLDDAARAERLLPTDARIGVQCARLLFTRLVRKLERVPAHLLLERRVRVSNPAKALLVARVVATRGRAAT